MFERSKIVLLFLLYGCFVHAQSDTLQEGTSYRKTLNDIEVDFLYSYYQQDGDHSPVLGGKGTEYLTDNVGHISVVVPSGKNTFSILGGLDHYTSASTDNINPATISSASVVDNRGYIHLGWDRDRGRTEYGFHVGYSGEFDVQSVSMGGKWAWNDKYDNHQLLLAGQYFRDQWTLIYPIELRPNKELPRGTDVRNIFDASLTWSAVINSRLQTSLTAQVVHQNGLLATPFHRVYFEGVDYPDIERLPRERWKIPVSLRVSYYLNEVFVLRSFYRYYTDNFDIRAHTAEVELPIRMGLNWAFSPYYRYHTQTGSKYFAPKYVHQSSEEFYTSDYDLSEFQSNQVGLLIRYSPVGGIWNQKIPTLPYLDFIHGVQLKKIEARGGVYRRSDGLHSWIASLGCKFIIH